MYLDRYFTLMMSIIANIGDNLLHFPECCEVSNKSRQKTSKIQYILSFL